MTNNNLNDSGEDQIQSVRAELITLAEKGEIKHSAAYIKKASHSALEKIKGDYERKQLEETNEYIHCKSGSVVPTPKKCICTLI